MDTHIFLYIFSIIVLSLKTRIQVYTSTSIYIYTVAIYIYTVAIYKYIATVANGPLTKLVK